MDEPVRVKYVPVDVVKEYIKHYMWLTPEFDEMVEKYSIDTVEYKCCVSVTDQEASLFDRYPDFTVKDYIKKRALEWFSEFAEKHIKCTGVSRVPMMYGATEYYYGIMVGEVPKWKQKGENDGKSSEVQ